MHGVDYTNCLSLQRNWLLKLSMSSPCLANLAARVAQRSTQRSPIAAKTAMRAFGMCLERKARVRRTTPPPESVVAGWYENASLLDSYSIDLSSSKQHSMRVLATRAVGEPPHGSRRWSRCATPW